jgi:apolipoprotein N-acyltransferase
MISESGEIENIFFKNKPVPMVEGSVPGNGEIPVIATMDSKIGISICYDADFPSLIQKAGVQDVDILFLPSGDWKEISPYHADMARVRAIENGFSLVRPVSGATTIACDFNGRLISKRDFYDQGERIMVASVPIKGKNTVYGLIGDSLAIVCIAITLSFTAWLISSAVRLKWFSVKGQGISG